MHIRHKRLLLLGVLAVILISSFLAEIFFSQGISISDVSNRLRPPHLLHPFGTDAFGRDVFLRVLAAARISILSALFIVVVSGLIGTFVGMLSGYHGGKLDALLMTVCDLFLSFPQMVIAIAIAGVMGGGLRNAVIALSVSNWMLFARLARSATLKEKTELYVTAAKFAGLNDFEILWKHIFLNIKNLLLVTLTLNFANMLLSLAGLSFLGVGVKIPTPEWGAMISEGREYLSSAPWIVLFPCLAIFLTVWLVHMLADTLKTKSERELYEKND